MGCAQYQDNCDDAQFVDDCCAEDGSPSAIMQPKRGNSTGDSEDKVIYLLESTPELSEEGSCDEQVKDKLLQPVASTSDVPPRRKSARIRNQKLNRRRKNKRKREN